MIGKFRDRIVRALDQITHVLHFFWGDNLGSLEVNDHFNIVDLVLQCKTVKQWWFGMTRLLKQWWFDF